MNSSYDVIIVGAGPAGSTAARYLAKGALKVLLVDRVNCIGSKVQCAEYAPKIIGRFAQIGAGDIAQEVRGIKTFIGGQLVSTLDAPGFILNRSSWDRRLWDSARAAGAKTMLQTSVIGLDDKGVKLHSGAGNTSTNARIIVGCDGPNSVVSKWLGNAEQDSSIALQYEMSLSNPLDYAHIYFDPIFYGGYAWVFPKGDRANVGLGVHKSCKKIIEGLLDRFCTQLISNSVLRDRTVLDKTAGLVPDGGLVSKLSNERMLLAGDAAGCTNPITGAGIMSAVVSGQLAAECVLNWFKEERSNFKLSLYQAKLIEQFGEGLQRALERKTYRDAAWTNDPVKFIELIRHSWIAFPEYYKKLGY